MIFLSAGAAPGKPSKYEGRGIIYELTLKKSECKYSPMKEYKKLEGIIKT
jgi:hypothetical protein